MTQSSHSSPTLHATSRGLYGHVIRGILWVVMVSSVYIGMVTYMVLRQSQLDHTQTADAAIVLGAAVWDGNPSPALKARLDHALALYQQKRLGSSSSLVAPVPAIQCQKRQPVHGTSKDLGCQPR